MTKLEKEVAREELKKKIMEFQAEHSNQGKWNGSDEKLHQEWSETIQSMLADLVALM